MSRIFDDRPFVCIWPEGSFEKKSKKGSSRISVSFGQTDLSDARKIVAGLDEMGGAWEGDRCFFDMKHLAQVLERVERLGCRIDIAPHLLVLARKESHK